MRTYPHEFHSDLPTLQMTSSGPKAECVKSCVRDHTWRQIFRWTRTFSKEHCGKRREDKEGCRNQGSQGIRWATRAAWREQAVRQTPMGPRLRLQEEPIPKVNVL